MIKYVDVSGTTSQAVMGHRVKPRRGIVIHETIGTDSLAWLQGGSAKSGRPASSDFLVDRVGTIKQITVGGRFAYHTGTARHRLVQDPDYTLNASFVGVELENDPTKGQRITTPQYIACAALIRRLVQQHDISLLDIVGHYMVALPYGRKTDPLTLNWAMLTQEIINPSAQQLYIKWPAVLP